MDMAGEYRIKAPRQTVWEGLNDPEILKQSIPGCEELTKTADDELEAKVRAKIGPVSAKFAGKVTLSNINAPESYTIAGEGRGGAAGFAKGSADVHLTEEGDETLLKYDAKADVGGKLAQIGSRLVQGSAKKMADDFFTRFSAIVSGEEITSKTNENAGSSPPHIEPASGNSQPTVSQPAMAASNSAAETSDFMDWGRNPLLWIAAIVVVGIILALIV